MAISMRTQVNRTRWKYTFMALAAWVSLTCMASCLSGGETPAGGRVEHPQQRAPMPTASAKGAQDVSPPPSRGPFSPLDTTIADDCLSLPGAGPGLPRAWSQNVPDRDCTNDGECGDGFCDRGHCAAIWSCGERYGQRCEKGRTVPSRWVAGERCNGICLEGRCRSCQSDAECVKEGASECNRARDSSGGRLCGIPGPKAHWKGPNSP